MSELVLVGLNHKRAPVDVRESIAFPEQEKIPFLRSLATSKGVLGAVLLSTCNRVELYAELEKPAAPGDLISFLCESRGVPGAGEAGFFYTRLGKDAVRHLFRVASGLDSMVLGEPQILGQVKEAYFLARDGGTTTTPLNILFQKAFHVAKMVRTQTGVGQRPVTISYAAFNLARGIFSDLSTKRILLLGAGEMSRILATHFIEHDVSQVLIANRTLERGREFAAQFGAEVVAWEEFPRALIKSDIVVTSTASQRPVIHRPMMETVMKIRRWASLFLIDIAVPRDVDPEVGKLDGLYLYNIDDLQEAAEEGMAERKERAARAESLITSELDLYARFLDHRQLSDLIGGLMDWVGEIQDEEAAGALRKLGPLSPEQEIVVRNAVRRVVHKIVHSPITRIKQLVLEENADQAIRFFRELFPIKDTRRQEEEKR